MNLEERMKYRKKLRQRRRMAKGICLVILFFCILLLIGAVMVTEPPKVEAYEYDTCRTLWDLAERYCPEDMDKQTFIYEVMELNAMTNATVYGNRLYMVPIYEK